MEAAPVPIHNTTTSYKYEALNQTSQSIRLIRLQPASKFTSDIHCDIFHVFLNECPEYEALSYAWGDPSVTKRIFLQGCPFEATVNLVSALQHLRQSGNARIMWVDALCIDQSNVAERGHQVAFMAKIYSGALRDILWLGDDPDDDARHAFHFVTNIARKTFGLLDNVEAIGRILQQVGTPPLAFKRCFNDRPVWKRIWIVQEICVARQILLCCGKYFLAWESFAQLSSILSGPLNFLLKVKYYVLCDSAFAIAEIRDDHSKNANSTSILALWHSLIYFEASDPRDKIFALLGIASPLQIEADYTRSTTDVFTDVIRLSILQDRNLDNLGFYHGCVLELENKAIRLPTWVPDLGSSKHRHNLLRYHTSIFSASSELYRSLNLAENSSLSMHSASLVLSGVELDTVKKIYSKYKHDTNVGTWDEWKACRHTIRQLPSYLLDRQYNDKEPGIRACVRTLTGDLPTGEWYGRQSEYETETLCRTFRYFRSWRASIYAKLSKVLPTPTFDLNNSSMIKSQVEFLRKSNVILMGFNFSTSKRDFMAVIPETAREGDILCVLYGSRVPHVLRRKLGSDTYELIGRAYVHGFMDGEAIRRRDEGELKEKTFVLV